MKQKAIFLAFHVLCTLCAIVVTFWSFGVAAAADVSPFEKQFARLDSSLSRLAGLPEVRMKEVAPFNGVAKQVLAAHPEIASVMRTNSKGIVVNSVIRAGGGNEAYADVSRLEWYTVPKTTMHPYYSMLRKENRRSYLVWSRPLSISMTIGGSRFGGVVAVSLDLTACFNQSAAAMRGPFQILLDGKSFYYLSWNEGQAFDESPLVVPGNTHFSLKIPRKNIAKVPLMALAGAAAAAPAQREAVRVPEKKETLGRSAPGPDISDKQELPPYDENADLESKTGSVAKPDNASGRAGRGSGSAFLQIAGAVAFLLVVFCLWLIISTLRKWQSLKPSTSPGIEKQPVPPSEEGAQEPLADGTGIEEEKTVENRPPYADIPAFPLPQQYEMTPAPVTEPVVEQVAAPPVEHHETLEKPADGREEINGIDEQQVHDEIVADIRAEMRAKITDEQRDAIYEKEFEAMASAIRQRLIDTEMAGLVETLRKQLAGELHQHIAETMTASIQEQERKAVEREVAEKIRVEEYDAVVRAEREKLSESVRTKLAEEESAVCTSEARKNLRDEIYETVRKGEEEVFTAQAREEIAAEIRNNLLEKEKDSILSQQRRNIETELYEEVSRQKRDAIRESAIKEITEEEHQRIGSGLRKTILEDEKNRIINEEAPGMRQQVRRQMQDEEFENMHRTVRDEIYSETVQAIKQNLEDKYRTVVEEKIAELNVHLRKKMKSDIRAAMKADYEQLMEHIEQLSGSLTNIEALQSLSQTITLLTDEKKKYKYLNLNTAQTESLLEYLKRVHNRLNIFFDKVDESVRVLMLNLNSVKNKLDNNE
jgi:hypothetical protein